MAALVLVLALFVLAFRMWTAPILAMLNLMLAIIWTSGFIAVTFGRLNLITIVFAVILIGLGIDFAIHLNAVFSTARGEGKPLDACLREMYRRAGPGVITGALTTGTAFFALVFTGLDALAEFGIVLGAGILITLAASLTLLPAMYAVHFRVAGRLQTQKARAPKRPLLTFGFLGHVGEGIRRHPWPALAAVLAITAGLTLASSKASFEQDTMAILPPDMPSLTLHYAIIEKFELFPDYSLVTSTDFDKTRDIVEKLRKNRPIGRVDAVTDYLPSKEEQRKRSARVVRIRDQMMRILSPVKERTSG
jgi:predicted RND superfamily exporter protein